jgi:hypothetical protein
MPAAILEIADAVTSDLNAAAFSKPITAVRTYLPRYKLEDLSSVRVSVVPKDDVGQRASRVQWQQDYKIDVAVQQRLGSNEQSQMDELMLLVQELADHFKEHALSGNQSVLVECSYAPLFDPEHLEKHKTLTTVLNLTFRGWRP